MTPKTIPAHVLVVDDDAMSRELLCILLGAEGYAVESADSGESALVLLGRDRPAPDLVLADVQMPGTTGAQLAGKLRRACGERTLLLAMSGSRPPEKAISRFDGFLLKPFRMEEIAAALSTRSQREAAAEAPAKREGWTVVRGPAGAALPTRKLVSIHAPAAHVASKEGMNNPGHDATGGTCLQLPGVEREDFSATRRLHARAAAPGAVHDVRERCARAHCNHAQARGRA